MLCMLPVRCEFYGYVYVFNLVIALIEHKICIERNTKFQTTNVYAEFCTVLADS